MMNNKKYEVIANDFNSPFVRNYIWTKAPYKFPELFGVTCPNLAISSKENVIEYLAEMSTWSSAHNDLVKVVEKDYDFVNKLIDITNKFGEDFNKWSEENIYNSDLSKLKNEELLELLNSFVEKQASLYSYGIVLPALDFGGFSFVESNLEKFLKSKTKDEATFKKYYDLFTQPLHNSFAQDQEVALLELMSQFYEKKEWIEDVKTKRLDEIKNLYSDFYNKLKDHTAKYSWVYYVYAGPAFTEQHFFDFIKDYLIKNIVPQQKLKDLELRRKEIDDLREKLINELSPDKFNEMILRVVGKMVWAKPRRKDYQSKSYFHLEKLMKEISKRLFISLSQARSSTVEIIAEGLKNDNLDLNTINSIYKFHICLPDGKGGVMVLTGDKAKDYYAEFIKKEELKDFSQIKEIKGTIAQSGKARGVVKIINTAVDMDKMNQGDILVSVATTPSVVPAMKKAAAIVTNEGGLTCHAAIVSRELGLTCLIGTKIATQVLKDGDMVEVDAEKGIVRILK